MVWLWHASAALIAALVVLSIIRPLSWLAHRYGWVFTHPPTSREVIVQDVPFVGGLAALVGLFTANLVSPWPDSAFGIIMAMFMVIIFGLMADLAVLPRWHRMAVLAGASLATVIGCDALIGSTGPVLGPVELPMTWIAIPLSMLFVLVLAVAFRRVDRADGLCDGLALVAALGVLAICGLQGMNGASPEQVSHVGSVALAEVGTLLALAFFTWRWRLRRVASVYLSNGGSSMLGVLTAWLLLQAQGGLGEESIGLGTLLWLVSVPMADMSMFALRVLLTGSPEVVQDRSRLQHLLQAKYFSMGQAMMIQLGAAAALSLFAIGAWQMGMPDYLMFYGWLVAFAGYAYWALTFWAMAVRQVASPTFEVPQPMANRGWSDAVARMTKVTRRLATSATGSLTGSSPGSLTGSLTGSLPGSLPGAVSDERASSPVDSDTQTGIDFRTAMKAALARGRGFGSNAGPTPGTSTDEEAGGGETDKASSLAFKPAWSRVRAADPARFLGAPLPRQERVWTAERNDPAVRVQPVPAAIKPTWRTVAEIEREAGIRAEQGAMRDAERSDERGVERGDQRDIERGVERHAVQTRIDQ